MYNGESFTSISASMVLHPPIKKRKEREIQKKQWFGTFAAKNSLLLNRVVELSGYITSSKDSLKKQLSCMRILKIRTEKERQQILRGKEKKKKETN